MSDLTFQDLQPATPTYNAGAPGRTQRPGSRNSCHTTASRGSIILRLTLTKDKHT